MPAEFSGNIAHTLDLKGRAIIPAAYREQLGDDFTIGLNNEFVAIALYPKSKWTSIGDKLSQIPESDVRGMRYVRQINGNSFPNCALDAQGRVLLPPTLRTKAGMTKNVRFVGIGDHLEIWDEERFIAHSEATESDLINLLDYVNDQYFKPRP